MNVTKSYKWFFISAIFGCGNHGSAEESPSSTLVQSVVMEGTSIDVQLYTRLLSPEDEHTDDQGLDNDDDLDEKTSAENGDESASAEDHAPFAFTSGAILPTGQIVIHFHPEPINWMKVQEPELRAFMKKQFVQEAIARNDQLPVSYHGEPPASKFALPITFHDVHYLSFILKPSDEFIRNVDQNIRFRLSIGNLNSPGKPISSLRIRRGTKNRPVEYNITREVEFALPSPKVILGEDFSRALERGFAEFEVITQLVGDDDQLLHQGRTPEGLRYCFGTPEEEAGTAPASAH